MEELVEMVSTCATKSS